MVTIVALSFLEGYRPWRPLRSYRNYSLVYTLATNWQLLLLLLLLPLLLNLLKTEIVQMPVQYYFTFVHRRGAEIPPMNSVVVCILLLIKRQCMSRCKERGQWVPPKGVLGRMGGNLLQFRS